MPMMEKERMVHRDPVVEESRPVDESGAIGQDRTIYGKAIVDESRTTHESCPVGEERSAREAGRCEAGIRDHDGTVKAAHCAHVALEADHSTRASLEAAEPTHATVEASEASHTTMEAPETAAKPAHTGFGWHRKYDHTDTEHGSDQPSSRAFHRSKCDAHDHVLQA
jgi:hypothetical protein